MKPTPGFASSVRPSAKRAISRCLFTCGSALGGGWGTGSSCLSVLDMNRRWWPVRAILAIVFYCLVAVVRSVIDNSIIDLLRRYGRGFGGCRLSRMLMPDLGFGWYCVRRCLNCADSGSSRYFRWRPVSLRPRNLSASRMFSLPIMDSIRTGRKYNNPDQHDYWKCITPCNRGRQTVLLGFA